VTRIRVASVESKPAELKGQASGAARASRPTCVVAQPSSLAADLPSSRSTSSRCQGRLSTSLSCSNEALIVLLGWTVTEWSRHSGLLFELLSVDGARVGRPSGSRLTLAFDDQIEGRGVSRLSEDDVLFATSCVCSTTPAARASARACRLFGIRRSTYYVWGGSSQRSRKMRRITAR
jgi:hypothetical protein